MDEAEKQIGDRMPDNKCTVNIEFDAEFIDCVLDLVEAQQSHVDLCREHLPKEVVESGCFISSEALIQDKVAELNSCKSVITNKENTL